MSVTFERIESLKELTVFAVDVGMSTAYRCLDLNLWVLLRKRNQSRLHEFAYPFATATRWTVP